MTIEQTVVPVAVTFDMPGDRQYSMIRGIPAHLSRDEYAQIIESYELAAGVRDQYFNGSGEPSEENEPATAPAQQARTAARQGGQRDNPWPPTVVKATDDDGNATVGCSWHKKGDGTPRPMRVWDEDSGLMKCTGKTGKTDSGFCELTFQPEAAPVAATSGGAPPIGDELLR